ncbi:MAG: hypothetical protein II826_08380 [Prevotella sp.]|nr:hypothetical protein [Prevotella sp.]
MKSYFLFFLLFCLFISETINAAIWTIGEGQQFASINVAMSDSRVVDGDELVIAGDLTTAYDYFQEQNVTKRVTVTGNGFKDYNQTYTNISLVAEGTVLRLFTANFINIGANNVVVERCKSIQIKGKVGTIHNNATIRGCWVTGGIVAGYYPTSAGSADGWTIHNCIILGGGTFIISLDNAVINHNLIVKRESFLAIFPNAFTKGTLTNNIILDLSTQDKIFSDWNAQTIINRNIFSSTPKSYTSQNKGGYTKAQLFVCLGDEDSEAYWKLSATSPAKGYATDFTDCGPWRGTFPYLEGGGVKPEEPTSIVTQDCSIEEIQDVYNLMGQKQALGNLQSAIYIINGRKVFIK